MGDHLRTGKTPRHRTRHPGLHSSSHPSVGGHSECQLSPVQTGDKVEFNTVDFVENQQSRPRCFGLVHTGSKVGGIGNKVDCDKLSNSSCCRFVAKTGSKVGRIGNKVDRVCDSRLCCRFVVNFGSSSTSSPVCTGL